MNKRRNKRAEKIGLVTTTAEPEMINGLLSLAELGHHRPDVLKIGQMSTQFRATMESLGYA